jgi:hypothetical protein
MDIVAGAEVLRFRIEQHEHWQQARSVRLGTQAASDPEAYLLESCKPLLRVYRVERKVEFYEGQRALVISRLRKHLVDGEWHSERLIEGVERVA